MSWTQLDPGFRSALICYTHANFEDDDTIDSPIPTTFSAQKKITVDRVTSIDMRSLLKRRSIGKYDFSATKSTKGWEIVSP